MSKTSFCALALGLLTLSCTQAAPRGSYRAGTSPTPAAKAPLENSKDAELEPDLAFTVVEQARRQ